MVGSIGVIMQGVNAEELMTKIGISTQTVKAGKYKESGTPTRKWLDYEEKQLQKIRVSKKEGVAIAQWFKNTVTKWYELELNTEDTKHTKRNFTINEFAKKGEYSFDFSVEAFYRLLKFGNGIEEPVEHEVKIDSYSAELLTIFNSEGEEIILQQKYIQEIEDYFYSVLKLQINYIRII